MGEKPANCPESPDLADGDDSDPTKGPLDEYGYCLPLNTTAAAPVANFSSTSTALTKGQSVTFTDLSTNTPKSWSWTFEGGIPSTSTEQNPSVTYNATGTFNVSLTVSNAVGIDTKSETAFINVTEPVVAPVASFSATPSTINEGSEVSFTDLTSNEPTAWSWTFAGATPSSSEDQNPKVRYNTPGTYDVILTVTNSGGTNTKTIPNYIEVIDIVEAPVAAFSANNTSISEGQSVSFTDLSTNTPTTWNWTFNGGSPASSTSKNPTVVYATPGVYSVTLSAENDGGTNTVTKSGYITVQDIPDAPVVNFSANNTDISEGQSVSFTDLSTNTPTIWNWTFNGGSPASSTSKNPTVVYATPGVYSVILSAENDGGTNTVTKSGYITVQDIPDAPVVNFSANNTDISEGQSVSFTDLSTNTPTIWNWTFNGGSPASSTSKNPTVIYATPGVYSVILSAENDGGTNTVTKSGYITVQDIPDAPVVNFSANNTDISEGQSVSFTDLSTNTPTIWNWTFNGGSPASSTSKNPTVVYATPGIYSVTLSAENDGGSNTVTKSGFITVQEIIEAPIADFSADITTVLEGGEISFSDKSKNTPSSWKWDFEGGNPATSTERNPKVAYHSANNYKVSLTVTNAAGNHTKTIDNYITVETAPEPGYCTPSPDATDEWIAEVHMGDNHHTSGSEGYSDNTATNFNFIAGSDNSITLVPGFSGKSSFEYWGIWIDFNSDKIFTEDEKVFTSSKSKSSVSGTIYIPQTNITTRMRVAMGSISPTACDYTKTGEVEDYTVVISEPAPEPPVAAFSASSTAIASGQSIQFSNLSENEPTSYQWSFPGGTPSESTEADPVVTYSNSGTYDVTLIAYKDGFASSEKTISAYITVTDNDAAPTPSNYCEPALISSMQYYIKDVNIGNELSVNSYGDGYSFDTNPFTLNAGGTYTVDLVPNKTNSRNFWRIWIDFNNDGDFDDADETVLALNNKKGSISETISIPSYVTGTTRIRITMKEGKAPAACDDDFPGEVEDYLVSFAAPEFQESISKASSESLLTMDLKVYPNPTTDWLNLQLSEFSEQAFYAIYNTVGKKVMEQPINAPLTTIDMSDKAPGIYLVVVKTDAQIFNEKVIKR
ncbi:PKD domain-containing protein [Draconibacterium halophilum]|nr:PKD domain-containing protein [Draconibacterium halophilum]